MSPENKGLNITFEPVEKKLQLDEETKEKISGKLEGFFEKENLWEKVRNSKHYVMATYPNRNFPGGPLLMIKPEEDSEEQGWWLRISVGPTNYMEFTLDREDKRVEITDLTFVEKAYSSVLVDGWIDSVLNGIRTAQERDSFQWENK